MLLRRRMKRAACMTASRRCRSLNTPISISLHAVLQQQPATTAMSRTASISKALQRLLPSQLPSSLSSRPGNLFQVLSRYPNDGVGQKVHQTRWGPKGIAGSYWQVTRASLKKEGEHGKAWGRLIWRGQSQLPGHHFVCSHLPLSPLLTPIIVAIGKAVSKREERIRGALKYSWMQGSSHTP